MQNTSIISYFNITANIYNQTLRPSYYVFSIFKMAAVRHLTPAVHCPVTARWHADWSLTTRQTPAVHCPVTARWLVIDHEADTSSSLPCHCTLTGHWPQGRHQQFTARWLVIDHEAEYTSSSLPRHCTAAALQHASQNRIHKLSIPDNWWKYCSKYN